jgi:hypothetical protein
VTLGSWEMCVSRNVGVSRVACRSGGDVSLMRRARIDRVGSCCAESWMPYRRLRTPAEPLPQPHMIGTSETAAHASHSNGIATPMRREEFAGIKARRSLEPTFKSATAPARPANVCFARRADLRAPLRFPTRASVSNEIRVEDGSHFTNSTSASLAANPEAKSELASLSAPARRAGSSSTRADSMRPAVTAVASFPSGTFS